MSEPAAETKHKMRPPAAATMQRVKNCYPKMSKKEKRFDPAKASIPTIMTEQPVALIFQHIPHQSVEYFRGDAIFFLTKLCKFEISGRAAVENRAMWQL